VPERLEEDHLRRPQVAAPDHPGGDPHRAVEAGVLADSQDQPAGLRRLDHGPPGPHGDRERLLDQRVDPGLQAGERLDVMQPDLGGDVDGVDHTGVEHGADVGEDLRPDVVLEFRDRNGSRGQRIVAAEDGRHVLAARGQEGAGPIRSREQMAVMRKSSTPAARRAA
jgi:hypothetical protein